MRAAGLDACVDYKATKDLADDLSKACPEGVDVYFDNVGGPVLAAAMRVLSVHARVVLCGMVSAINTDGEIQHTQDLRPAFVKRASLLPVLVSDHWHRFDAFAEDMEGWIEQGGIGLHEEVLDGLAAAPDGLRRLLGGEARGRVLIRCDAAAPRHFNFEQGSGV